MSFDLEFRVRLLQDKEGVCHAHWTLEEAAAWSYLLWREVVDKAGEGGFELSARVYKSMSVIVAATRALYKVDVPLLASGASFLKYLGGILSSSLVMELLHLMISRWPSSRSYSL